MRKSDRFRETGIDGRAGFQLSCETRRSVKAYTTAIALNLDGLYTLLYILFVFYYAEIDSLGWILVVKLR